MGFIQTFRQGNPCSSPEDFLREVRAKMPARILESYTPAGNQVPQLRSWLLSGAEYTNAPGGLELRAYYSADGDGAIVKIFVAANHSSSLASVVRLLAYEAFEVLIFLAWPGGLELARNVISCGVDAFAPPLQTRTVAYDVVANLFAHVYVSISTQASPGPVETYQRDLVAEWMSFIFEDEPASSRPLDSDGLTVPAKYIATFSDGSETASAEFRAWTDGAACEFADDIAARSDAWWGSLTRVTQLSVPREDGAGGAINAHYQQPAAAGSDVQRKGRAVYRSAVAGDFITVEIPSVVPELVRRGERTSEVDPLPDLVRPRLRSENGASATQFRQVRFGRRLRGA